MSIEHLVIDLDDPRAKLPGENAYCEEMANQYFATWQRMCGQLTRLLLGRSTNETSNRDHRTAFSLLGGINRSSAALVAWLIFQHELSAEAAIDMVLSVRPSLRPSEKRPHILWALKTWEAKRASLRESIIRVDVSASTRRGKKARRCQSMEMETFEMSVT